MSGRYISIQKYWALKRANFSSRVAKLMEKITLILLRRWYRRYYVTFNPILLFNYNLCIQNLLHSFWNEFIFYLTLKPISAFTKHILTLWKLIYTGLFISPSGISDPCGTVAGMVTPKGSMSTEIETLQVSVLPYRCSIFWLLRAPDKRFSHTLDSLGRWPRLASSFHSAQAATLLEFHVPLTNCFARRWFCAVHGPKPPLHRHNWLSFGKFKDTECFLIHCARHFSSRLPPSGGTSKYAKAPSTKKTLRDSLPIDMLLSAVSVLVVAQLSSEVPEGLMNNPVCNVQTNLY